ncbi:CaiB/BaiF CoA transferase family protein [Simiduia aestuariiviva]|uniref:Alpha-methylacyl-CoA racemase n=1 Tax=Simiduia aestuariiviva TaxID=1510459 RepID=A0A839USN8_9GAMM|nr:CaiB/BaiF CoA-transferase family protein [Simiduia aestuariiviva]MBB3169459.1 alpha-methylacyl-CoA racemase [Simiduia aestuariiviva]
MGPLAGFKIIEMKGIGPGPYAGMLLADMGAEVIVVERSTAPSGIVLPSAMDVNARGKKSIALNLKTDAGKAALLKLVSNADALFEGFRPGVAERLGFGPEVCLQQNPKLVYGRMTGWGQTGPLANTVGHDINYIALSGALAGIGGTDKPTVPLNLLGDYAGGSLFLVVGMLAALLEASKSGQGQVVDAAITEGSASLMSLFYTLSNLGVWQPKRQSNFLDGAAHFYDTYVTADEKSIAIGAIEPDFYQALLTLLGLASAELPPQNDPAHWPVLKQKFASIFKTKTRDEWCAILEGTDACFAPVLDYTEAPKHPHNIARETFIEINGKIQPAPAPKFSRSRCKKPAAPRAEGADTATVLSGWGFSDEEIAVLTSASGAD